MIASVIICTRNRSGALRETLAAFASLAIPPGLQVELIVVDNGSTDATAEIVRSTRPPHFDVKYVLEPVTGQATARNTGMRIARGEVFVFTDDDIRPAPGWLKAITEPIIDNRFDTLAGSVQIAPSLLRPWMTGRHKAWLASTDYLNPNVPESAVGANMSFSRRVLDQVPSFDEELGPGRLGFWDDTLFFCQLKRAGYRLGMATDAVVEHHFDVSRLSRSSFMARATGEGESLAHVAWHWKHETRAWPFLRLMRRELELTLKRRFLAKEWGHPDGMALWEMELVTGIAFLRHFEKIRFQPRAYDKYGPRKLILAHSG